MKKLALILTAVLLGTVMVHAATAEDKVATVNFTYGNAFIFVEDGITFSVFPDGELDFYIDNRVNVGVGAHIGNMGITFNSGFDYNPFVQYDDFGAVIQVENVPIFYDHFGRVAQVGNINVSYNNGLVRRLGGLNVFYNGGVFSHYTGFINIYNRRYVYRPFHRWFARPAIGFCNVWNTPYRRFYTPVRYTWYRPYVNNVRRGYVEIGREHRYNNVRRERASIYRNDDRVTVRENNVRSNRNTPNRSNAVASRGRSENTKAVRSNGNAQRSSNAVSQRSTSTVNRSNATVRSNGNSTVTKREVTRTPSSTTVNRSTTRYKEPVARSSSVRSTQQNAGRSVAQTRTQNSVRNTTAKAPSRSSSTVSQSSRSRTVSKEAPRSNSSSRSASARSAGRQ